jgi:hypothetical protein
LFFAFTVALLWRHFYGLKKSSHRRRNPMQTIRITISTEKAASVVNTEQRPESKEATRKAALAALDAMFDPVLNGKRSKKCN